jgi:hypothetical protein
MKRYIKYLALVAAAASMLTACDSSPTGVEFKRQDNFVTGNGTKGFTLPIVGQRSEHAAFQYITPEGGRVAAGGHEMLVPAGAVAQPTWFRMTVVGSDRIQVKLKAWRASDWAPVTQFPATAPIQLNLNVSNVTGIDLSQLLVVYLADGTADGRKEPVSSAVNADAKIVTGYLTHFSMYAIAFAREYSIGLD